MLGYSLAMPLLPFYIERFGVDGTELGWLMSTSLGRVEGPLWGGYIYDLDIDYPFFSGAATLLLELLVSLVGLKNKPVGSPKRTKQ